MTWMRLPLFVWTIEVYAWLLVAVLPTLSAGLTLLLLDRQFGTDFFLPDDGGQPLLYQHAFWFFGHPEVYIMILPAFGVISEVLPVFCRKPIFGYKAIAFSTVAIGFFSLLVWAHHMFTVGLPNYLNGFFMVASMLIGVPTGIKIFNWVATTWRGNLIFDTPLLYALGFLFVFTIGGISGIFVAAFPFDWQAHDTYFVVAHLHYVLFGGAIFGAASRALHYWWPKLFGRMLNERLGKLDVLARLHRLQRHLRAAAPARAARDGAEDLHLPRPGRLARVQPRLDDRLLHDGRRPAALLRQRAPDAARRGRASATTRGWRTRSSGTRPRRRRPRTSTASRT